MEIKKSKITELNLQSERFNDMFIFTIVVTIIFHSDFADQMHLMAFLKNLAIAGGFLIISTNEPKVCTLDYYLKNK